MSTTIDLPGGAKAELKDSDELTNREMKTMQRSTRVAMNIANDLEQQGFKDDDPESWKTIANLSDDDYDSLDVFQRTCVVLRLKSWTLDRPLPQTPNEVDDLPLSIYAPLTEAAVKINCDEGRLDPKADTANSAN